MTDFLDKLSMEVAEWGIGDTAYWYVRVNGRVEASERKIGYGEKFDVTFTKDQWLQRRRELVNEPDNLDAPEWAEWKAQDGDGTWHWYKGDRPRANETQWDIACGGGVGVASKGKTPAGHVWRTTLKEVNHLVGVDEVLDTLEEMMADCKEVKLAWANGERVQGSDGAEWITWENDYRLDLSVWDKWRVKPKTKLITQYEYRIFRGGVISTHSFGSFRDAENSLAYMLGEGAVLINTVGTHSYEVLV